MSKEQFKIWKQVEAKGLEKLEKVEKALASTEKEGFEEVHKDYCDFIEKLAETTGLTTGELDRHFTTLLAREGVRKMPPDRKEAVEKLRRLVNSDFKENEIKINLDYKDYLSKTDTSLLTVNK